MGRTAVRCALATVLVFVVLANLACEDHLRGITQRVELRGEKAAIFLAQ